MMNRVTVSGLRLRPTTTTVTTAATVHCSPSSHPHHAPSPTTALSCLDTPRRRAYATQHQQAKSGSSSASSPRRRAVTPFNDNGQVPWTELSLGEKTGRAAQQSVNFGVVVVGLILTGGVGYVLYSEVFSPDSKTTHFNRAVDRIRTDPRCIELLGDGKKMNAYGEETYNKWRRARPIASTVTKDGQGIEHLMIQFNVQGPKGIGRVGIHMIKRPGQHEHEYKYFFIDIKGHQRIYLENADAARPKEGEKGFKLFGVKWGS